MQRIAALIVLSGVIAAVAGCGGSGDSSTVTTSSLSKAAYVKKANALCEEARQEALAYRLPSGQEEEGPKAVTLTVHQGILPPIQRAMGEVRELGAPKGDEPKVEAILVGNEKAVEKAEGMKFTSLGDMEEVFLSTAEKARGYGIKNCGY